MKILKDRFGKDVRLPSERIAHILEHPEMVGLESQIELALQKPERVIRSSTDSSVRLYYRLAEGTMFGRKWLCVVVKHLQQDAFVLTAYLSAAMKKGEQLWPIK